MSGESLQVYLNEKETANGYFREGSYLKASDLYIHTICKILDIKDENVNSIKDHINTRSYNVESQEVRHLLSTLLCNLALCYSNLKMKEYTQIMCESCLCVDGSNYKAAYHLACHYLSLKEYNISLKYIQICQQIVNGNFALWKDRKQPHLELVENIRRIISKTDKVTNIDCGTILEDVLNGNNINLNIQRLLLVNPNELMKYNVFEKLVKLCSSKVSDGIIDDTLASLWSVLYQLLCGSNDKCSVDLYQCFDTSLVEGVVAPHAIELARLFETSKLVSDTVKCAILEHALTNIIKICSVLRTSESLDILYTLLDKTDQILEQVLAGIMGFFSKAERISVNSRLNVALAKILEQLISMCDPENAVKRTQQLDACLIAIFKAGFGTYESAIDAFGNLVSRVTNAYITKSVNMDEREGITLQPTWYMIVKSLFIANKPIFKSYIIANDLIRPLLVNFFRPDLSECSFEFSQIYASQIIVNCMEFVEFRQEFVDFVLDETFLDHLIKETQFVSFIAKLGNAKDLQKIYTTASPLQEYKLLMLSKLSIHSIELKDEIVSHVDLFKILPNLLLLNMDKGYPIEMSLECISYLSLHKEFKTANFSFLPPLLVSVEREGNSKILLMTCQTVVNLLRGNKDRSRFLNTSSAYDVEQLEALKNIQEKLPEMAKATINGRYFEGDHDLACKTRHYLFLLQENILISSMIKLCKKIRDITNPTYMLAIESLHYIALEQSHRRTMQSMGVLRVFINYAIGNVNKCSNAFKSISLSIAHICTAITPSNLSYNDAVDTVQPLITLLADENEMFQYEAAMALTNLLSINDDIKRRVFGLRGWQLFGNLIYSDNDMLKTVGLEGWCNLSAGEDVVHGSIYSQIIGQFLARDNESVFELNHADLNILLAFVLEFNNEPAVIASTGALALLTRDLRIAQYIIFAKRFENILKALNKTSSVPILHRILTILSCVSQAKLRDAKEADKKHEKYIKDLIKTETKKNSHKYVNKTLTNLAAEI